MLPSQSVLYVFPMLRFLEKQFVSSIGTGRVILFPKIKNIVYVANKLCCLIANAF